MFNNSVSFEGKSFGMHFLNVFYLVNLILVIFMLTLFTSFIVQNGRTQMKWRVYGITIRTYSAWLK